jgi:nucleoside-diphosphate-sugar epimerase
MAGIQDIIEEMLSVAPAGHRGLPDAAAQERLRSLTGLLIEADPTAAQEYRRFIAIKQRHLDFAALVPALRQAYAGKRILVTGGTGCIGRLLLRQLRALHAGPTFSVSRGRRASRALPGVRYLSADICDGDALTAVIAKARPDVIFHLAAQRDPGLAERAVFETVLTNALGTRNVLRAARETGVERFSHASTGKAMRYYTKDTYAASKKLSEWLLQEYASEGNSAGAARFTHVIDNSIVLRNLKKALPGGIARIHDPSIEFYVQSAAEAAQLLLLAGLNERDHLRLFAIRDLGEPVRLLSMAVGLLGQRSNFPPIYFPGFDPGYEKGVYPGLYDPRTAGDLSPLINAIEAVSAAEVRDVPAVDGFELTLPVNGTIDDLVDGLAHECSTGDPASVTRMLCQASRTMSYTTFASADPSLFSRLQRLAASSGGSLPCQPVSTSEPSYAAVSG